MLVQCRGVHVVVLVELVRVVVIKSSPRGESRYVVGYACDCGSACDCCRLCL